MNLKFSACGALLAVASVNAVACYTVYDRNNQVVYNAQTAPVDMRYQIHETLPRVFPGAHMVFDDSTDCPVTQERAPRAGDAVARLGEDRDMVFTELRDPAVTLYGRVQPTQR